MAHDFEFYETPTTFTKYLFREMHRLGISIAGRVFEPCVGSGAIIRGAEAAEIRQPFAVDRWSTNDLDTRWSADTYLDARDIFCPVLERIEWTVSNPPFTPALEIIENALTFSRVGVAMHLRASIHEVLKTGTRRTWMADHTPNGILWLPRFAYQRSKKSGDWSTDSVCACWVIWLKPTLSVQCGPGQPDFGESALKPRPQFIRYAPEWVLDELTAETPAYRKRMDKIMAERKVA